MAEQAHEINKLQEELQKVAAEAERKAVAAKTAAESTAKALTEKTSAINELRATVQHRDDHITQLVTNLIQLQQEVGEHIEEEDYLHAKIKKLNGQLRDAEDGLQRARREVNTARDARDQDCQQAFQAGIEHGKKALTPKPKPSPPPAEDSIQESLAKIKAMIEGETWHERGRGRRDARRDDRRDDRRGHEPRGRKKK